MGMYAVMYRLGCVEDTTGLDWPMSRMSPQWYRLARRG
jgi:hypothetical protein